MNKHLLEAGLLFFLAPLLSNAVPLDDPRFDYFRIPNQIVEPLNESKSNLYQTLAIQAIHGCFLRFTVSVTNSNLTGKLIDNTGDPLQEVDQGFIMVSPHQQETSLIAGQMMTLHWVYPFRYLLETNKVELRVHIYSSSSVSDFVTEIFSFSLSVFHPKDWALEGDGSIARPPVYGSFIRYPETIHNVAWVTEFQNCANTLENPVQNILPLAKARIRSCDYEGLPRRFAFTKATLRLLADEGDYTIGESHFDATSRWRDFPLMLGPAADRSAFASFALAEDYAVSIDGRVMKKASEKTERDVLTRSLYLPPVKTGKLKTFAFSLLIEGAGEFGWDDFHWTISVEKDKNYFGTISNSDYGVEVS